MKIKDHLDKAERIGELRNRLDPADDYELWYWASLNAGMNLFNAALHHLGATVAEDCFCPQPAGLHPPRRRRRHV